MKVRELVGIQYVLRRAGAQVGPIDSRARIARLLLEIEPYVNAYNEKRIELLKRTGTLSGDRYEFESDERKQEFEEEHAAVLDEEVTLQVQPIPAKHLDGAQVDFGDLVQMMKLGIVE